MAEKHNHIKVSWQGEDAFLGESDNGGKALLGEINGDAGIRPMQMILASLAACSGVDVVGILNKKRANLQRVEIHVNGERADTHPKVYTDIHVEYLIWGEGLREKDVEKAIDLSENKYCSVSAMLKSTATIHSSYRILAPGEEL